MAQRPLELQSWQLAMEHKTQEVLLASWKDVTQAEQMLGCSQVRQLVMLQATQVSLKRVKLVKQSAQISLAEQAEQLPTAQENGLQVPLVSL